MMSKRRVILMTLCFISIAMTAEAQTYSEWFRQKKTQRKYLQQQIAALRTYGGALKKGYGIVKDGSGVIKGITGGEFNLHKSFFFSLRGVNPELLKSGKVATIISMQQEMEAQRRTTNKKVSASDFITAREKIETKMLFDGMGKDCHRILEELELVVTDGKLELADDERIKRIDSIYEATQRLYRLHRRTVSSLLSMIAAREREMQEMKILKEMQGVK